MSTITQLVMVVYKGDGMLPALIAIIGLAKMLYGMYGPPGNITAYFTGAGLWFTGLHLLSRLIEN